MKIGIDIGGSHISIGLIDNTDKIIQVKSKDLSKNNKENIKIFIENSLISTINDILKENKIDKSEIELIGVAVPGRTNKDGNIWLVNLNLENYPIKHILQEEFNTKIQIRNDAKCSALCEKKYGNLLNYKDAVFLCLGTGIGSAVFLQDKLLMTSTSESFELGHMIIAAEGKKCNCGKKGCFEQYASMRVFKENILKVLNEKSDLPGEKILEILKNEKNNKEIEQIIKQFIKYLSIGIINIMEIFEPEAICIGGSFVHFKDILLELLVKEIENQKHLAQLVPKIELAKMENEAGILGAVL